MKRPAIAEITESVGDVVSSGASVIGDLASTAASRTGDLASSALERAATAKEAVSDAARDRFAPPPKRSKKPLVLLIALVSGAVLYWWTRRDPAPGPGSSYRPSGAAAGSQVEDSPNPAAY